MKCCFRDVVYVLFSIFLVTTLGNPLYSPTDPIVLLENDTISSTIYNSSVAWFVEFFSSWCGHCQSFAPSWKRLANQVEGWTNVIRVAAIDCAEGRNIRTCENFSIQGYPTLKFFKAYSTNPKDIGRNYKGKRSPRKMRHAVIDFLESGGNPKFQHNFTPLSTKLDDKFFKEETSIKHIALVFEKNTSYLGRELMLDLMNNPKISIRRIVNDGARKDKYQVTTLPEVVLLVKDKRIHLSNQTREGVLSQLKRFDVVQKTPPTPKAIEATNLHFQELHKNDIFNVNPVNISIVHMQDLEGALSFIFRREVVIKRTIGVAILKNFVDLLVQCFPGRPPVNNFLRLLQVWLEERRRKKITPDAIRLFYAMHQADPTAQMPEEQNWKTCQGSMPQYRGYPCSLWLLFHTLTVNCAARNVTRLSGADVLMRIRGYVTTFFGCLECGRHFAAMSQNVSREVKSHDQAILWLWNAHNKVNRRLSKEPSTDPKFPKIIYPPREMCSDCIQVDKRNSNATWKVDVILQFLKVHYGVNNIRLMSENSQAQSDEKDLSESVRIMTGGEQLVRAIGFGMNKFDTSLCVVVYGAGILFLAMLYVYILKRRRRGFKYQLRIP